MSWINVKIDLPKKDGAYLCYDKHHSMMRVLMYNDYHKCWDHEDGDDYYTGLVDGYVSHWMELPTEPKDDDTTNCVCDNPSMKRNGCCRNCGGIME